MNGQINAVAGKPKEGKTTYIKQFKTRKPAIGYARIGSDFDDGKTIIFTNFLEFLKVANTKRNIVCYIDEAFTCLPEKLNIKMDNPLHPHNLLADFLVNSRKMNRFVFFVFHSLAQIPKWLLPYLDNLIRFNTNDQFQYEINRFRTFPEIVASLVASPTLPKYQPDEIKLR